MRPPRIRPVRGHDGELVYPWEVEVFHAPLDPDDHRTLDEIGAQWSAEVAEERFHVAHENCDAPWRCLGCERLVCPRCWPSPAEPELCPECYWQADPEEAA